MTAAFTHTRHHRHPCIPHPELGPWAGILFLLCALLMTAAKLEYLAPYVQLPMASTTSCFPERHSLILSIDSRNRFYIAASEEKLQTAIIQQVAQQNCIYFTPAQLKELRKMPFLSQNIRQLPTWLLASKVERQLQPLGIPAVANEDQVSEFVAASTTVCEALYGKPIYFTLRADKSLTAVQVLKMVDLLQKQGINRFNLIAEKE